MQGGSFVLRQQLVILNNGLLCLSLNLVGSNINSSGIGDEFLPQSAFIYSRPFVIVLKNLRDV